MGPKSQEVATTDSSESTENSAKKSGSSKENTVQFDESTKAPRKRTVLRKQPEPPGESTKFKVTPKEFMIHCSLVVGFLLFFFTFTFLTRHKRAAKNARPKHSALSSLVDTLAQVDSTLAEVFVEAEIPDSSLDFNLTVSATSVQSNNCTIYLAESSIPNNGGFGLFTAKPFNLGDSIMSKDGETLVIRGVKVNPMFLAMRHHPLFGNVDFFKKGSSSVVSSRSIAAGEELFLDLSDLEKQKLNALSIDLHKEMRSDPTKEVYDRVDVIVRRLLESIPYSRGASTTVKPKKKNYKQRTPRILQSSSGPTIDASPVLQMMKETLEDYDPEVSVLIPKTTAAARTIKERGGSANFVSNKRTSDWLSKHGVCLDGVYEGTSTSNAAEEGFFASREVSKGDIVMTAPLLALQGSEVSDASKRMCFYHEEHDAILLCPLSFAYNFSHAPDLKMGCNSTYEDGSCANNAGNAYYQWSEVNSWNAEQQKLKSDYFIQNPFTRLSIDIIASRTIGKDEEVFIDNQVLGGVLSNLN